MAVDYTVAVAREAQGWLGPATSVLFLLSRPAELLRISTAEWAARSQGRI